MRATNPKILAALAVVVVAIAVAVPVFATGAAAGDSLGSLNSQLGAAQAHQASLSASVARLNGLVSSLNGQISLVESREASVQSQLDADRNRLLALRGQLQTEQLKLARLHAILARARTILSRQLISQYENTRPDLITVVLESGGFKSLLDTLQYLSDAEHQQQHVITIARQAKAQAQAAAIRLTGLERNQRQVTDATAQRVAALAGMNRLLHSRQAALARAQDAQQAALAASRERGRQLQADIAKVKAQQAAAERAAAQSTGTPTALSPALGPSGGWAIPYAIVLCESGGQNLTPNSAGASGYYQIMPATWKLFGGSGPAAYQASKSEQDAVASRIWNGGSGASNWVCAGIVGIH
jgi:septal ring factor EnvC (AmiA/AmiB activator)